MPLRETSFNLQKSDLKFIEAAASEVVAIASPVVYNNTIIDNVTGHICADKSQLVKLLEHYSYHPETLRPVAQQARQWCQTNRMQYQQTQERLDWYLKLWNKREQLTSELLKRVPELR